MEDEKSYVQIFKDSVLKSSIEYLKEGMGAYSTFNTIREALNDAEFAEAVIKKDPRRAIELIPKEILKENPNLYAIAMEEDPSYVHYVPNSVKKQYPDLCLKIVIQDPWQLQSVPLEIQSEHADEILEAIAEKNPGSLRFVKDSIITENQEKCMEIVKKDYGTLKYIPEEIQEQHIDEIKNIVKENPSAYRYIKSNNIKESNPEMAIEALNMDQSVMSSIPPSILRENIELCREIVEKDRMAWFDLPEEIKGEIEKPNFYNFKKQNQPQKVNQEKEQNQEKESGNHYMLARVKESKFAQIYQKTRGHLKGVIENLKNNFVATLQEVQEIPEKIKGLPKDIKEMYITMKQIPGDIKTAYNERKNEGRQENEHDDDFTK